MIILQCNIGSYYTTINILSLSCLFVLGSANHQRMRHAGVEYTVHGHYTDVVTKSLLSQLHTVYCLKHKNGGFVQRTVHATRQIQMCKREESGGTVNTGVWKGIFLFSQ